jgi:large repetitive protein
LHWTDRTWNTAHGTVVKSEANQNLVYTPNSNFNGVDQIGIYVSDCGGASSTIYITVTSVNDAPEAIDDDYIATEDTALVINVANGVLANDNDVDGDTLTATLSTEPSGGVANIQPDGSFTYTPNRNFNGDDSFEYTVSDGNGGTDKAVVTITVTSVNDAPEAVDDDYTATEDTALVVNVADGLLANDNDVDEDTLTATLSTDPGSGVANIHPDGSFTYMPNKNFNGDDSFEYMVSDGNGGTDKAVVAITVTPVNYAPVANDATASVDEDSSVIISVSASDPDGDALTITITQDPAQGTIADNNDGTFTYMPNENYHGSDNFKYIVADGEFESNEATVTITINSINDDPEAIDDDYTATEDTACPSISLMGCWLTIMMSRETRLLQP